MEDVASSDALDEAYEWLCHRLANSRFNWKGEGGLKGAVRAGVHFLKEVVRPRGEIVRDDERV